MKVKDIIEELSKYDENEILLITWWKKEFVEETLEEFLTQSQWDEVVTAEYNWSDINDQIDFILGK